ncbi:hypothetical protein D6D15_08174 [Aureobasidium pullulans]|uniref:Uncharacterized protein n=1 Tax=Aureobasidium pullulans TaxID=5580 RepID=A0A4V4IUF8_AURPU|nr:hypothetical protein D6D15_08174 [Aureobasidium pullulans]
MHSIILGWMLLAPGIYVTARTTLTGTAMTPGGTVPITVLDPPSTTFFSTTTVPGTESFPYTSTGKPSFPGGTVPQQLKRSQLLDFDSRIDEFYHFRSIEFYVEQPSNIYLGDRVDQLALINFLGTPDKLGSSDIPQLDREQPLFDFIELDASEQFCLFIIYIFCSAPLNVDLAGSHNFKLCVKQCFDVFELHASQELYPLFCDVFYLKICNEQLEFDVRDPLFFFFSNFDSINQRIDQHIYLPNHNSDSPSICGVIAVTPGQIIRAISGGSGSLSTQGLSAYGDGGRGGANSGGGGAASALYIASDLIIVAGGGGGQGGAISSSGQNVAGDYRYPGDANNGTAGTVGKTRMQTNANGGVLSTAGGGQPGTNSAGGAGGSASGYSDAAVSGMSGNGHVGGDYAVTSNTDLTYISGAGGGGCFGGGSGANSYWLASGVISAISGGGAGGSSFVSGNVTNSIQYASGFNVGQVLKSCL